MGVAVVPGDQLHLEEGKEGEGKGRALKPP